MAFELKEGQGTLFKNEKQNDRQPDYKGTILIGGTTYEIAAWEKTSQRGTTFLSLQASLPRENASRPQAPISPEQPRTAPVPIIDDLPADNQEEDLPF